MEVTNGAVAIAIVSQFAAIAAILANSWVASAREKRQRAWAIEDRQWQTDATAAQTKAIAAHTTEVVGEATDAAHLAYKEANDVNLKIQALGIDHAKTEQAIQQAIKIGIEAGILKHGKTPAG